MYCISNCIICRPSDFTVSEDAGTEPRTVATTALAVRRCNHSARSRPHFHHFRKFKFQNRCEKCSLFPISRLPDPDPGDLNQCGSIWVKKQGSRSGTNNLDHISESLEKPFFGLKKYLNSLMRVRDPGWKKFGSGIEKFGSGIRDKHPGSATVDEV